MPKPKQQKANNTVKVRRIGKDKKTYEYYIQTDAESILARIRHAGEEKAAKEWRKIVNSLGKPVNQLSALEQKELNEKFNAHQKKWRQKTNEQIARFNQKKSQQERT